jgi:hypothetical protein
MQAGVRDDEFGIREDEVADVKHIEIDGSRGVPGSFGRTPHERLNLLERF